MKVCSVLNSCSCSSSSELCLAVVVVVVVCYLLLAAGELFSVLSLATLGHSGGLRFLKSKLGLGSARLGPVQSANDEVISRETNYCALERTTQASICVCVCVFNLNPEFVNKSLALWFSSFSSRD